MLLCESFYVLLNNLSHIALSLNSYNLPVVVGTVEVETVVAVGTAVAGAGKLGQLAEKKHKNVRRIYS